MVYVFVFLFCLLAVLLFCFVSPPFYSQVLLFVTVVCLITYTTLQGRYSMAKVMLQLIYLWSKEVMSNVLVLTARGSIILQNTVRYFTISDT